MTYSINVKNESTGKEELFKGMDADSVLKEIAAKLFKIKYGEYYRSESESKRFTREIKKDLALKTTDQIQSLIDSKKLILKNSLENKINVWNHLKKSLNIDFVEPKPGPKDISTEPEYLQIPLCPQKSDKKYIIAKSLLDRILKKNYLQKVSNAQRLFEDDLNIWKELKNEIEIRNKRISQDYEENLNDIKIEYDSAINDWENRKKQFGDNQKKASETIDKLQLEYFDKEISAIETYNDELLKIAYESRSFSPYECEMIYNSSNEILSVEYLLPDIDSISSVCEVKYIITKDFFEEKLMNRKNYVTFYDEVIYQITLSVINEIFKYDEANAINSIIFNAYVKTIDKATGENVRPYILSILVSKSEFSKINLSQVDVRQCFKNLKGVCASELASQTAIAPIIKIDKNDRRFIESKDIVDNLNASMNIAAMDWEDFEHLVRELFEKEFSQNGGEVRVTQASRDGGVDAIAFDPDPIRGGKIVIQAKRYTNTVGVNAVRDLYGTLMNEGATKGILVTTSDYGSDAYSFAKGKPITLLNGANLLFLLEKHGHKAKIDLNEAKKILNEEN